MKYQYIYSASRYPVMFFLIFDRRISKKPLSANSNAAGKPYLRCRCHTPFSNFHSREQIPGTPSQALGEGETMAVIDTREGLWPSLRTIPEPAVFREARVEPDEAYYNKDFGEFILPYEAVRTSDSPDKKLLSFFQGTYEVAANLSRWDRESLEHTWSPPFTHKEKMIDW